VEQRTFCAKCGEQRVIHMVFAGPYHVVDSARCPVCKETRSARGIVLVAESVWRYCSGTLLRRS